ncbi:MAG: phosphatidate cytidylyltransferase [Thiobacillaceae bacterium]
MRRRLITGAALIAGLLLALSLAPARVWSLLMLAIATAGAWEWAGLMPLKPASRQLYTGITALLIALAVASGWQDSPWVYLPAFSFWLLLAPLWLMGHWHLRTPLAMAALGWLLLVPAPLAMIYLRELGSAALLTVVGIVVVADSAAYFAGRRFGRHKLAPRISPGKTWEGFLGAWLGVGLYALLLDLLQAGPGGGLFQTLVVFWGLFVLSVAGDLFESWMKREAGVKDSGRLLPGHGGVLDRIDSLLAVLPAAVLYWMWMQ